jgi:branched-chain amino acid transport system ATP-binding protein
MNALSVQSACVSYGVLPALRNVSLSVAKGECLAIVGANGAGKSSLMRFIAGAQAGTGVVQLGAAPAPKFQAARARAGIGYVPEGRRLFPSLSVRENIELGAETQRDGPWDMVRLTTMFPDLTQFMDRPATALSGGQQQMVAIARALRGNPAVLLCDEVSLGLAPKVVSQMYRALAEIRQGDMAMIVVEQDLEKALSIADRLICIRQGKVTLEAQANSVDRTAVEAAYFGTSGEAA